MKRRHILVMGLGIAMLALGLARCRGRDTSTGVRGGGSAADRFAKHRDPRRLARGSVVGTVRDEARAPVAGARVCARLRSPDLPGELTRDPVCTDTNALGEYGLRDLYPSQIQVAAMAKQFVPGNSPTFGLAAGEQRANVDLVLRRGGVELTGSITDAGGGLVAHAQVRVEAMWPRDDGPLMVESDDHGRYAAWVRPGTTFVVAVADGYATGRSRGEAPGEIDLVLVPESTLGGVVVDAETGEPVAGVGVYVDFAEPTRHPTVDGDTAITDEHGRFQLSRLLPGRYLTIARSAHGFGRSDASTQAALGQHVEDIVVRLHAAYQVVGRVVIEPNQEVCHDASVSLYDAGRDHGAWGTVDPDGTLRADGLMPGTYAPSPGCAHYSPRSTYDPIVITDHDVTDVAWPVTAGAKIIGRVLNKGTPIEYADVEAYTVTDPARPRDFPDFASSSSGPTGEFELRGLRPGHYKVAATLPHGTTLRAELDITGSETVQHEFKLDADTGTLAGRVVSSDGAKVGEVYVRVIGPDDWDNGVVADDGGNFKLERIPPGNYKIAISDHFGDMRVVGDNPDHANAVVQVDQVANARVVVEGRSGTIRGRVVDDRGAPVTDAFVAAARETPNTATAIQSARDDNYHQVLVRADGTFVVTGLDSGAYTVRAARKGGAEASETHVALGTTVTLQLEPTGSIDGIVRRPGGTIENLKIAVTDRVTRSTVREESSFRTGGRFVVRDLPAGLYTVLATSGDAQQIVDADVVGGAAAHVELELQSLVTVVGRAVEQRAHQPVSALRVSVAAAAVGYSPSYQMDHRDITDVDGRFELTMIPRTRIVLSGYAGNQGNRTLTLINAVRTLPTTGDVIDIGDVDVLVSERGEVQGNSGLGVTITDPNGAPDARIVVVTRSDPDGPGDRAGIVVGDVITAVDGVDVSGLGADAADPMMTGPPGTSFQLKLQRGTTAKITLVAP